MPRWDLSGHVERFEGAGSYSSVEVKRSFVDAALIGDTTVVPAQGAGIKIRVLALVAESALAPSIFFKSGATKISATLPLVANTPKEWAYVAHGWFETNANEAFVLNQSIAAATGVEVIWIPIK